MIQDPRTKEKSANENNKRQTKRKTVNRKL